MTNFIVEPLNKLASKIFSSWKSLAAFGVLTAVLGLGQTAFGEFTYEVLHQFGVIESGSFPNGLIQARDSNFYGTTAAGGEFKNGTIFKMDPVGNLTTLHSFSGSDGACPYFKLVQGADGSFYGTSAKGGSAGLGVLFRFRSPENTLQLPGDCNQDGITDRSDGICLLSHLLLGEPAKLPCSDGSASHPANVQLMNWNHDAEVDISDAIGIFKWLYLGGPPHFLGQGCQWISGCPSVCTP